jgi:hypothetical protein
MTISFDYAYNEQYNHSLLVMTSAPGPSDNSQVIHNEMITSTDIVMGLQN